MSACFASGLYCGRAVSTPTADGESLSQEQVTQPLRVSLSLPDSWVLPGDLEG
jgi:hypothetical protein